MNKRRSQTEWRRLIDEQAHSGLTQKAFCKQAGIPVASFGYWKRKLRPERINASTPGAARSKTISLADWIELSTEGPASGPGWQIELELGNGVCLRLRQG